MAGIYNIINIINQLKRKTADYNDTTPYSIIYINTMFYRLTNNFIVFAVFFKVFKVLHSITDFHYFFCGYNTSPSYVIILGVEKLVVCSTISLVEHAINTHI